MHDWIVLGTKANATGNITFESNRIKGIKSLQVNIPCKELKSEKKSGKMDKKIYEALKIEKHPNITFDLIRITAMPTEANGNMMNALGTLTIGGYSKEETLNVLVKVTDSNTINFSGSKKIKMTDFKISPPTAMMGMLKTGDDIEIKFDCSMKQNQLN
jgi:polyisoprenoid-binding protein YceI